MEAYIMSKIQQFYDLHFSQELLKQMGPTRYKKEESPI